MFNVACPDGGIGRRVGLKHQCRKACRFEPGSGYKKRLRAFSTFFIFIKLSHLEDPRQLQYISAIASYFFRCCLKKL